ncbi:hypothetical protein Tco_0037354 [Tanacetum coccineum]
MESSGGSASGSISDFVSEDLRRKLQAGTSAYEAKKQKELAMMEFKEMEFLTIDADKLPEPKASIIRKRQEKIIAKICTLFFSRYFNSSEDKDSEKDSSSDDDAGTYDYDHREDKSDDDEGDNDGGG